MCRVGAEGLREVAFAPSFSPYRAIPEYLDPPALLTATAARFTGLTALLCGLLPLDGEMLLFDPFSTLHGLAGIGRVYYGVAGMMVARVHV